MMQSFGVFKPPAMKSIKELSWWRANLRFGWIIAVMLWLSFIAEGGNYYFPFFLQKTSLFAEWMSTEGGTERTFCVRDYKRIITTNPDQISKWPQTPKCPCLWYESSHSDLREASHATLSGYQWQLTVLLGVDWISQSFAPVFCSAGGGRRIISLNVNGFVKGKLQRFYASKFC